MRAIPLVRIRVGNENPDARTPLLEIPNRDRDVVQNAEPFTMIRKCVVRPSRQIGRHPVVQRRPDGPPSSLDLPSASVVKRLPRRQTQGRSFTFGEIICDQSVEIPGLMNPLNEPPIRWIDLRNFLRRQHLSAQQHPVRVAKFPHRKRMTLREFKVVSRRVETTHRAR